MYDYWADQLISKYRGRLLDRLEKNIARIAKLSYLVSELEKMSFLLGRNEWNGFYSEIGKFGPILSD